MKNIKSIKKNAFLLLIVLAIILYFILKDDFSNIVKALINVDLKWIFLAIISIAVYWILRALSLFIITKEYSKKLKFKRIFALTLITQFFNGITPFSSGGQPMEVYYLSKSGIRASKGSNIIIQNFIFYQTALILHGIIAICLNYRFRFFKEITLLKELTLIGFFINILVGIGLLIISFSAKFNRMVVKTLICFGHKIKLIKDKDASMHKWQDRLDEFHESGVLLAKNKKIFVKGVIYNFLALAILYSIPLFVIYSMGNFDINVIETITASAYVLIIGAFVPIPGGSGGIEFGFMQFFGNFITGPLLSASLLVWRFITYYLGIIIGAITINFLKGDVKK
jgi:uncharacterized protein (TIRG00374 family)